MTPTSPSTPPPDDLPADADDRTRQIAEHLVALRARIDRAAAAADRRDRPELVVVTKTFPAEDVVRLARLGVGEVGENKDQEASAKAAETDELLGALSEAPPRPRWHFVGQLQSNKARSVLNYADVVHSVDRSSLLKALVRAGAERADRPVDCLIQVDLRRQVPEDARGGAAPDRIGAMAERIAEAEGLRMAGLMAVAPLDEDPAPAFARLAELSEELRRGHPEAAWISAGMSGDLEAAVAAGATHLRIGRDVLGHRPEPR
ncbi:MAG: YggS family pyridoxal phosphate-dependent enzyme [Nesterenkonia sp.]|uniref:YggS family pyridoxal phosphate-dependent enzyme n=1 Tax=Nesterenkonia marinintestina TaxID=2979865 RepID=UPI0021BEDBAC|nr:YggS family pyridoxal phosphate-dependent enzyme [Nesterenkonia sp. GX14115]MDO5493677.1 YggS family pyridoxal phosphate-dependent enzyme [Nesterenkonia sp.]